jgi:hypothetical protein
MKIDLLTGEAATVLHATGAGLLVSIGSESRTKEGCSYPQQMLVFAWDAADAQEFDRIWRSLGGADGLRWSDGDPV